MHVLLLNAGSSSLKAAVVDSPTGAVVARGSAEWAGGATRYEYDGPGPGPGVRAADASWQGHASAVRHFAADLPPSLRGGVAAVGHRVVHGGSFAAPVRITADVRSRLAALADLAPLHNPPALEALAAAEAAWPAAPHVAVFDTAFFQATLPPVAYTYPVPSRWTGDWGIRRYGFHGLSHAYCARRATEVVGRPAAELRLVTCHLGHGCSAAAIHRGQCVDTTMGFTPMEGLMMATRSGSIDPGIILHVQQRHGLTPAQVDRTLNRESGLLGVSGLSADMRVVLSEAARGHERARLALEMYCDRVRQTIGALAVTMGGVDAVAFTAGVGENSAEVRAAVCAGLECLGLELDHGANATSRPDADVATPDSRARILVIAAREEVTMLHEVVAALKNE